MKHTIYFMCFILFIIAVFIEAAYSTRCDYRNEYKKALINGKDTCQIICQDGDGFLFKNSHKEVEVIYKDNLGKYTTQRFPEQMITILK